MLKKISLLIIMFSLSFVLTACGKKKASTNVWEDENNQSEEAGTEVQTRARINAVADDRADQEDKELLEREIPTDKKDLEKLLRDLEKAASREEDLDAEDDLDSELDSLEKEDEAEEKVLEKEDEQDEGALRTR